MKRMGYREALEFCAVEGEHLMDAYGSYNDVMGKEQIVVEAAGDIMVATIAAIFGKDPKAVARAVIRRQEANGRR